MTTAYFTKIAQENNLNIAHTNYNTRVAYGFATVQDAAEFAEEHGLELAICSRSVHHRDGAWKVLKEGGWIEKKGLEDAIEDTVSDLGWVYTDAKEYWQTDMADELAWLLKDKSGDITCAVYECDREEFIKTYNEKKAILDELEELEEGQVLVRWDGTGTEVVNVMRGELEFDNTNFIVGVYDPDSVALEDVTITDIYDLCDVINLAATSDDYPQEIVDNAIEEFGWEDLQHEDNNICRDEDGNLLTIDEDGKAVVI